MTQIHLRYLQVSFQGVVACPQESKSFYSHLNFHGGCYPPKVFDSYLYLDFLRRIYVGIGTPSALTHKIVFQTTMSEPPLLHINTTPLTKMANRDAKLKTIEDKISLV